MTLADRMRALISPAPPTGPPPANLAGGAVAAPGATIPGNGARAAVVDYTAPNPIAVQGQRGIETLYGAGQAGKLGQVRWGEKSATWEGHSYAGDLGPLQRYAGGQLVATLATQRNVAGMESGLPATSTVPGQPANPMLALLIQNDYVQGQTR